MLGALVADKLSVVISILNSVSLGATMATNCLSTVVVLVLLSSGTPEAEIDHINSYLMEYSMVVFYVIGGTSALVQLRNRIMKKKRPGCGPHKVWRLRVTAAREKDKVSLNDAEWRLKCHGRDVTL